VKEKEMEIRYDMTGVDWKDVAQTLKSVGMSYHEPDEHRRAFAASHTTVFAYRGDRMIGFGRALADGVYQAALYDIAVVPEFQGQGVGTLIVQKILEGLPGCNVILYAAAGREGFYEKFGFRRLKTGMALFTNAQVMTQKGITE